MASFEHLWSSCPDINLLEDRSPNASPDSNFFNLLELPDFDYRYPNDINLLDMDSSSQPNMNINNSQNLLLREDMQILFPRQPQSEEHKDLVDQNGYNNNDIVELRNQNVFLTLENKRLENLLTAQNKTIERLQQKIDSIEELKGDDAWIAKYEDVEAFEERVHFFRIEIEGLRKHIERKENDIRLERSNSQEAYNNILREQRYKVELLEAKLLESKLEQESLKIVIATKQAQIESLQHQISDASMDSSSGSINESLTYINQELEKSLLEERIAQLLKEIKKYQERIRGNKLRSRQKIIRLKAIIQEKDSENEALKYLADTLLTENSRLRQ